MTNYNCRSCGSQPEENFPPSHRQNGKECRSCRNKRISQAKAAKFYLCVVCKQEKVAENFTKYFRRPDLRDSVCRNCWPQEKSRRSKTEEARKINASRQMKYRDDLARIEGRKVYKRLFKDGQGRVCSGQCGEYKSWDQFYSKRQGMCKVCRLYVLWVERLNRVYSISPKEFEWLVRQHDNRCYLCEEEETRIHKTSKEAMKLSIDHFHGCKEHESAKACKKCIRGLLCANCNLMIGNAEGRPLVSCRFDDYLERRPFNDRSS